MNMLPKNYQKLTSAILFSNYTFIFTSPLLTTVYVKYLVEQI